MTCGRCWRASRAALLRSRAATRRSAELKQAVAGFRQAAQNGDRAQLVAAKTRFYSVLMEGAGNVFVKQSLTMLHNRITLLRFTSMTQQGRLDDSVAEIEAIYEAIAARDGARAEQACKHHIAMAAKVALAVLAREPRSRLIRRIDRLSDSDQKSGRRCAAAALEE